MGLMDYSWDDLFTDDSSDDSSLFSSGSDIWNSDDDSSSFKSDDSPSWTWWNSSDSFNWFSDYDEDTDFSSLDADDDDKDSGSLLSKAGDLLGKVPTSIWDKLLDAGIGGLSEWIKQKDDEDVKPATKGGGGSGYRAPVTAVTSSIPVGTRTVK